MGHAYYNIAFTRSVKAAQERHGSRRIYGHLDQEDAGGARLDEREIAFLAAADHFFQASVSETGWPYVQHRGGPAGFLRVLDQRTIGFADLGGNRQYISLGNLQHDDRVALIIVDWSARRRLKLMGWVSLVEASEDPELVARLAVPGYGVAERAYIIRLAGFDWNCPQHLTERIPRAQAERQLAALRQEVASLRQSVAPPSAAIVQGDGPLTLVVRALRQASSQLCLAELATADGAPLPAEPSTTCSLELLLRRPDGELVHVFFPAGPIAGQRDALQLHLSPVRGAQHAAVLPLLQLGAILEGVHLRPAPGSGA